MPVLKKIPRALVAGCAGFIGSHLVESLLQKNILVTGVDNLSTGKKIYLEHSLQNPNFKFVEYDLNIGIPQEIENEKYDYIFHLASAESHTRDDTDGIEYEILLTNSLATRNLLDFSVKNHSKFVLASSLGIYQGFVSSVSLENYFGSSEEEEKAFSYSEAKRFAEALVWQYYKQNGLDVRVVRLSEVYGPRMSLKSTASLGTLLDYFLHEQDLIVSGDGLSKERYAYVTDAVNLLETSMLGDNGKGLILPLVPNLTTPLEIAYLLKDMSKGALDILFRPSKKVDVIPTVEKIDVSSLNKIDYQIKVAFKEGIQETVTWFGKITANKQQLVEDVGIKKEIEVAPIESIQPRINPNEKTKIKFMPQVSKSLKMILLIIAITILLTGVFIIVYEIFSSNSFESAKVETSSYIEDYQNGKYQTLIANINKPQDESSFFDGVFGKKANSNRDFSKDYLIQYLKYISESKVDLNKIYTNVFSKQPQSNSLIRVSLIVAKIEAANRYLSLYESSLNKEPAEIDIKKEQDQNKNLLILTNNTAELFSGDKKYLIVTADSSKSSYFLGEVVKQYLLHTTDYNLNEISAVDISAESVPQLDFAEYAMEYVKTAKTKLGGDLNGILFIDNKVLNNLEPMDFALSVVNGTTLNVDNLLRAIDDRKVIFFPTSSDISIAGDLGISPVLAFSDSSDFILINLDNTGGTNSSSYLISNLVYTLTENMRGYLASITLTLLHTGKEENSNFQGVFSGNANILFPTSASFFDVRSDGVLWKKSLEYQLSKAKYNTNLISYPIVINPGKSNTVTITYQLTKPTTSGYNLLVPKIANVKLQNFTLKFRPLDPSKFNLQEFQNDGGVFSYITTQKSNLTLNF